MSDGFYHAACPQLFAQHDTVTSLADCPFPLETETFKVVFFGVTKSQPDDEAKGRGKDKRFAVVEFVKGCGHIARERIEFSEGVKDFDHYGTKFTGASYSIADWKNRIEFFRQYPCEVCGMVKHCLWCFETGASASNRTKAFENCLFLLNANYTNWREFITETEILERFKLTKWNSK